MTTEFSPNLVAYGDVAGLGRWLVGHYRQHLRYNDVLAGRSPPVIIDDFPILELGSNSQERRVWADQHEKWHELIRPFANVTGIDLANIDFSDPSQFYQWIDLHNAEHALIDTAFGVA
jgi:hypothetical protein